MFSTPSSTCSRVAVLCGFCPMTFLLGLVFAKALRPLPRDPEPKKHRSAAVARTCSQRTKPPRIRVRSTNETRRVRYSPIPTKRTIARELLAEVSHQLCRTMEMMRVPEYKALERAQNSESFSTTVSCKRSFTIRIRRACAATLGCTPRVFGRSRGAGTGPNVGA
jgi:hypothetical protein